MLKCQFCGKNPFHANLKAGMIPDACYHKLPQSIKDYYADGQHGPISEVCFVFLSRLDDLFYTIGHLSIYRNGIGAYDWGICVQNITTVRIVFRIDEWLRNHQCRGKLFVRITTKHPEVTIEEPISDHPVDLDYAIKGGDRFVYYPHDLIVVVKAMQAALKNKEKSFASAMNAYKDYILKKGVKNLHEGERQRLNTLRIRREELRRKAEARAQAEERQKREEERKRRTRSQRTYRDAHESEFEAHNHHFQMVLPYTMCDLKKRWKVLMLENHPDTGGSNEMATCINKEMEVLKHYAS